MHRVEYFDTVEYEWVLLSDWDSYAAADAEVDELVWDNPSYQYRIAPTD